ncbi:hypothetical protein [Streptomyces nitrosporeus]|nr:hypothetical protein [Streptomyces nitrosporeus]
MAAALVAASCQGVSGKQFRELLSGLIRWQIGRPGQLLSVVPE